MAADPTGLEKTFNEWFVTKAPFQLPANAKETIVKLSPWITLVFLILMLPAVLLVLGIGSFVGAVATAAGVFTGPLYWLAMIMLVVQLVLMAISIPGLMKRKKAGWNFVYFGTLISVIYGVVNYLGYYNIGSLISALISAVVALYILFQIRSYYS